MRKLELLLALFIAAYVGLVVHLLGTEREMVGEVNASAGLLEQKVAQDRVELGRRRP